MASDGDQQGNAMCTQCLAYDMDQPGDQLGNAIRRNVVDNVAKLKSATPVLGAAVAQNKLKIVGGIYRLGDGRVELIG
jgi:carbonic anhydrase